MRFALASLISPGIPPGISPVASPGGPRRSRATLDPVSGRLAEIVRGALPGRGIPDELDALLAERLARAAAAWPAVTLSDERFVRAIAERLGDGAPGAALAAMHTDDLYLACGCADGDAAALAGFEQRCGQAIQRAFATMGAAQADRADLEQVVRQRLLVAPAAGGPARIASYSARAPLPAWVRVVATREAARRSPRAQRERSADDDELAGLLAADDDPELGYLKRLYRDEFKRAFHAAIDALPARDRLVLCQHLLDGLGIDQLAALHGVHRATTARWIHGAREAVLAGTQRALVDRLRLSRAEVVSVMRLIASQLDVSLARVLRPR
jgi:RNA polymerase sigma-70 factor (ECF subfamily)